MEDEFKGHKKYMDHFSRPFEKKIIEACLPWVPSWISTVHLTLMSIAWAVLVVYSGYLSNTNIRWLWAFSFCVIAQYVTDMLDGEIGRVRNEGLIKWGFYMDHFCDYLFLCAVIIGYSFLLPTTALSSLMVLLCLAACGGFMVHALLDFGITGDFKISFNRFGISEIRYLLVIGNAFLIFFGKQSLVRTFPFLVLICFIALGIVVYRSQTIYKRMDKNTSPKPPR